MMEHGEKKLFRISITRVAARETGQVPTNIKKNRTKKCIGRISVNRANKSLITVKGFRRHGIIGRLNHLNEISGSAIKA